MKKLLTVLLITLFCSSCITNHPRNKGDKLCMALCRKTFVGHGYTFSDLWRRVNLLQEDGKRCLCPVVIPIPGLYSPEKTDPKTK